ncbi:MAG TPA: YbhB/YbcL family Raf kinase inhibitor-like protein [Vicinamibacterales bacterium]|jgi:Raf kinase inhibitor-like YbhB/YbcL family protein|nr:YbhB/YbcL family Raf kinase inhibitor-like protein [Vicinamibacterales bacterium]
MRSRLFSSTLAAAAVAVALSATLAAQERQGAPGGQGGGGGRGGGRGGFAMVPMLLETDAYPDGGIVPAKYSNAGGSTMPGFKITNVPMGTVSFAVIFHDIEPNIGNPPNDVLHAMFWNVPAASGGWPEGPSTGASLPAGSVMGFNIQKKPVYMGPGAPAGPRYHHYIFEVYALNANLDLPPDSTREAVYAAMAGKVVGKAAYVGRFRGEAK